MIVYLDASAIVKRYVAEAGPPEVNDLIAKADAAGSGVISRAEVTAALAKAVRMNLLLRDEAASALQVFNSEWDSLIRLQLTEVVVARAATLAWELGLRGYDSVHLASALYWQEMIGEPVTLATFDRQLWEAAAKSSLIAWPEGGI